MPSRPLSTLLAGALALLACSLPTASRAATGVRHTLSELVAQSDATILGHPVAQDAFWDRGRIITKVTVQLDEVWHGTLNPGSTVDVFSLGGTVGPLGQRVDGAAALPRYGRMVLHLRRAQKGYVPTAMAQGLWTVDDLYGSRARVHHASALGSGQLALLQPDGGRGLPSDLASLRLAVKEAASVRP